MRTRFIIIIIFMLTACTPRLIPMPDPTQIELTSAPTQGDTPNMTPTPALPTAPNMQSLIDKAKEDLAQRLSISTTQINVVDAKDVTWSNSSLGCPQPGMAYLQVPEDGVLIVLQVTETLYEYHNGGNRGLFLCEKKIKEPALTPKLDIFNLTPSKSDLSPTTPDNSIPPGEDT